MSKALVACFRDRRPIDVQSLGRCADERLRPDNAPVRGGYLWQDDHCLTYVYSPRRSVRTNQGSVALGVLANAHPSEPKVGAPRPDGTFLLLRVGPNEVEALTDYTGSRTLWYALTSDVFIASSSQRLLTIALGAFEPNRQAAAWMVTNGHTGPVDSWNVWARLLPANSSVRLERHSWRLTVDDGSFLAVRGHESGPAEHREALEAAVSGAVASLGLSGHDWTLALSGGVDSRSLLFNLRNLPGLEAVTWGLEEALRDPDGDAAIAAALARRCGVPHTYVETDVRPERVEETLERFVCAGEGRIDHLSGYLDGLDFWAALARSGRGIIRGYDPFGFKPPVRSEFQARRANGLLLASDYDWPGWLQAPRVDHADLPDRLRRQGGESLADWRDRLWLQFRTPVLTAALDEIKTSYVEVVNPLLCTAVVEVVQSLPSGLRAHKRVFRDIVQDMFPDVPFARSSAIQHILDILDDPHVLDVVARDIQSPKLMEFFGEHAIVQASRALLGRNRTRATMSRRWKRTLRRHVPERVADLGRLGRRKERFSVTRLALRLSLIGRTLAMLEDDAAAGHSLRPPGHRDG